MNDLIFLKVNIIEMNYLSHRYKTISTNDLKKAFDSILDNSSNVNLKHNRLIIFIKSHN